MITGRLMEVNDKYYAILNLKHPDGKRLQKRFDLRLPVQNNKRRAQEALQALCAEYTRKQEVEQNLPNTVLIDFLQAWIERRKSVISPSTYRNYLHMAEHHMSDFFTDKLLRQITFREIEAYYQYLREKGLSSTTVQHHHMLLQSVFHEAYKQEIVPKNPMEFVDKPKRQKPIVSYYSVQEARQLLETVKGSKLELPVMLALVYGLRRSEVLGLRWSDINFEENRISICHTVVEGIEQGKRTLCEKDTMKEAASRRTMPLFEPITTLLREEWKQKEHFHPSLSAQTVREN